MTTRHTNRECSVVSDRSDVTNTDNSDVYYDARENVVDDLSASFRRDLKFSSTDTVVEAGKFRPRNDSGGGEAGIEEE
jgi:hypothetical protein